MALVLMTVLMLGTMVINMMLVSLSMAMMVTA